MEPTEEHEVRNQDRRRRRIVLLVVCAAGVALIGLAAGPIWFGEVRYYAAGGTVIYDGQPVEGATVSFIPLDHEGPMSAGITDRQGEFRLSTAGRQGVPAGRYRVAVRAVDETEKLDPLDQSLSDEEKRQIMMEMMMSEPQPTKFRVPQQYANTFTSGLTAEVTSDEDQNQFRFELE